MSTTAMIAKKPLGAAAALVLGLTGLLVSPGPAHADPVWHQVVYIVSSRNPAYVDIFYQDQDPTLFSDYSHNPYQFTPQVHADIAPGKPWVQPVNLLNPDQWAMVTVTTGREPGTPGIQCDLSVDGKVVVSKVGPKGALCSLRTW
ncbi:hypothetical protein A5672_12575 [Mycobacterium alsense]|uniref:Mycobacterium membrane protein n=2 Tax=Mycobacterium alsense TaxID=324058 RepID=A0ABD6P2U4_9MYCO|nr:hypothetical protein A5672_12575 [Mycobacterium alsense]